MVSIKSVSAKCFRSSFTACFVQSTGKKNQTRSKVSRPITASPASESFNTRWDLSAKQSSRVPAQPPGITWELWNSPGNAAEPSAGPSLEAMMSLGKLSSKHAVVIAFKAPGSTWQEGTLKGTARQFSQSVVLIVFSGSLLIAFGSVKTKSPHDV